jgi:hypothetical protein
MSAIRESFMRGSRRSLPAIVGDFFSRWATIGSPSSAA